MKVVVSNHRIKATAMSTMLMAMLNFLMVAKMVVVAPENDLLATDMMISFLQPVRRTAQGIVATKAITTSLMMAKNLNVTARQALEELTPPHSRDKDICVTTLSREAIPPAERGFMLFSAPPILESLPDTMRSWQEALKGKGTYVVITNDYQTRRVCQEHNIPTLCVEHSDEGLPLLDKLYERMEKSQPNGILAYVNSDIHAADISQLHDFFASLETNPLETYKPTKVDKPYKSTGKTSNFWLAVVVRTDVDDNGNKKLHEKGGYDFWAWNNKPNGIPLLPFDMPPFRFPFSNYDTWLLDMVVQVGQRNVIDISNVVDITHHQHMRVGEVKSWYMALMNGVSGVYMNRHLAYNEPRATLAAQGTAARPYKKIRHFKQFGTPLTCPYYAQQQKNGTFAILRRNSWTNLADEYENMIKRCAKRRRLCKHSKIVLANTQQSESDAAIIPFYGIPRNASEMEIAAFENWRYTMDEQLKNHATDDGFVLLTSANYANREKLMNFKCNLERLGMRDHFVVAAMDKEVYEWGVRRGLPIYYASSVVKGEENNNDRSTGFTASATVLEVLNKGYSVIWSDTDITWVDHPFDALAEFMRKDGGIAIQSNSPYVHNPIKNATPDETVSGVVVGSEDPAAAHRLDTALYVAPSNPLVISAIREIVEHARMTNKGPERMSFDEILCSRKPSERYKSSCKYRPAVNGAISNSDSSSLHVQLLDRFMFPHGAVLVGENNDNVYKLGRQLFVNTTGQELAAVHNNWISGEKQKKARQVAAGWWFGDDSFGCRYQGDEGLNGS